MFFLLPSRLGISNTYIHYRFPIVDNELVFASTNGGVVQTFPVRNCHCDDQHSTIGQLPVDPAR
jgi:hypothetical protein